ncbi:hypothetical protein AERO8C_130019 [Aeromonas veronii]|uniref:Uncharacterized protein n=1 Tax=Aeromonas veronii TaxID=654 RepID=A0A653KT68_AERVE|nr:hypothetical protein AERO8C_130019 [Aeromonas veronii]
MLLIFICFSFEQKTGQPMGLPCLIVSQTKAGWRFIELCSN